MQGTCRRNMLAVNVPLQEPVPPAAPSTLPAQACSAPHLNDKLGSVYNQNGPAPPACQLKLPGERDGWKCRRAESQRKHRSA